MKYIQFNADGKLLTRYDGAVHESIPRDAVEVSDTLFQQTLDEPGNWRLVNGQIVLVPPSAEEIRAARAAELQGEIDGLERESMMNRGVRELSLRQMEFFAVQLGQDLETIPAYVKFKALDDQVSALRIQLAELEAQS